MAKYTGNLFSDIKDMLDENELRQQRGIAERAADRAARKDKIDTAMGRNTPTGNIGSRVDFSNDKMGPNFNNVKKPIKVTKKETSVETAPGDIGSVDRTKDVMESAPDMSKVNKAVAEEKWMDPLEQARRSMGFKKGGKVKAKKMAGGGFVTKANGCAIRGKTRGRIV
jgi:hypothetical protein